MHNQRPQEGTPSNPSTSSPRHPVTPSPQLTLLRRVQEDGPGVRQVRHERPRVRQTDRRVLPARSRGRGPRPGRCCRLARGCTQAHEHHAPRAASDDRPWRARSRGPPRSGTVRLAQGGCGCGSTWGGGCGSVCVGVGVGGCCCRMRVCGIRVCVCMRGPNHNVVGSSNTPAAHG
jgi:hypothetical protein